MSLFVIGRWRPGRYARDSLLTFFGLGARAIAQAAMVLLLARWLGPEGYGQFVATLAVVSFFGPLAGFGLQGVLLRDISREPEAGPQLLAKALALWWRSALVSSMLAAALAFAVLPGSLAWWAVTALAFGEIFGSSGMELLARVEQAHHQLGRFAALLFGLIAARLLALLLYAAFVQPEVQEWMLVYAAASLFVLGGTLAWARPTKASGPIHWFKLAREGWPFASGGLAIRLQTEFNKPVLARIGFAEAGYFGIAQRVVDLASLPLVALQEALWPRIFASATPVHRALLTGTVLLLIAIVSGMLLTDIASSLPWFFGADYNPAVQLVVWLAWLPALQVARNLGNAMLIATHCSHVLHIVYATCSMVSVGVTMLLVSRFGLGGAVLAAYASEILALVVLGIGYILAKHKEK